MFKLIKEKPCFSTTLIVVTAVNFVFFYLIFKCLSGSYALNFSFVSFIISFLISTLALYTALFFDDKKDFANV